MRLLLWSWEATHTDREEDLALVQEMGAFPSPNSGGSDQAKCLQRLVDVRRVCVFG